ncbi:uncharacterized protein METZ01_LOCUS104817, partial [marine metagenome]
KTGIGLKFEVVQEMSIFFHFDLVHIF